MSITALVQCVQHGQHWSHAKYRVATIIAEKINEETRQWSIWHKDIEDAYLATGGSRSAIYGYMKALEAEGVFSREQIWERGNQKGSRFTWTWKPETVLSENSTVRLENSVVLSQDSAVLPEGHVTVDNRSSTGSIPEKSAALCAARKSEQDYRIEKASQRVTKARLRSSWTSTRGLVNYFKDSVLASTGRPALSGTGHSGALGKHFSNWHAEGVAFETIAAGIELWVSDPRNLTLIGDAQGDKTPMWLRFVNWFPPQQKRLAIRSGVEKSAIDETTERVLSGEYITRGMKLAF